MRVIVFIFLLPVCLLLFYRLLMGFFPVPMGVRHYINAMIEDSDLYMPIAFESFSFAEKGFVKTIKIQPKHLDVYEIGMAIEGEGLDSNYKYNGRLMVEIIHKDKKIYQDIVDRYKEAWYVKGNSDKYGKISLYKFNIPFLNKYINEISIRITVLDPDEYLASYPNDIGLYVAISASP